MITALVVALLATAPAQDTARGVIRGTVQSEPSGLPIPLAVVEAQGARRTVVGMSDSTGRYVLRVEAGTQTFRVRHLEHAPMEMQVLVPGGGEVVLDVALQHRPITLAPVRVVEPRPDSVAASEDEVGLVIQHHTMDESGTSLGTTLGGLEGTDTGGEALYVRGSASNLQLVLLDGAPVYAPFHMGGLIESFEPGAVASARLFLGGAPAQYDGGLSYVMDLTTRAGNRQRHSMSGGVDMLSARTVVDGPLPRGARYLASARTLHGFSLSRLEGEPFPYRFGDGLVRLDAPLAGGQLGMTLFGNREGVRLDTAHTQEDAFARWDNLAGSLRWRGRVEGAQAEFTVAGGRFRGSVPLRDTTSRAFLLNTVQDRLRLGADFARRPSGAVRLRYGVGLDRTWLRHRATEPAIPRTLVRARSTGTAIGAYLDGTWQPTSRVVLRGGVRADGYSVGGLYTVAPRASAAWLVTDRATLTLAAGRYHQYVLTPRPLERGVPPRNYADSARIPVALNVAGGSHLVLVLDQELAAGVRLGLEGFYKHFNGLPLPGTRGAHNSGVDVWVRRTAGEVTGWLGYSLGWAWNTLSDYKEPTPFRGRQTLSAGVNGPVMRHTRLALRMAYGEGLAYTSRPGATEEITGSATLPATQTEGVNLDTDAPLGGQGSGPFVRLDAELARTWNPRVAGRVATVTPYLRVINALESRDALIYRYFGQNQEAGTLQSVATLPLVPVLGVNFRF
ncbi:MAG TPA: hypothetical protein VF665_11710 [Longimicrobium sp.]|jgi:hypothetical protein|uniref:TonB-dependent receptor n=1 Tax=Longimicrobium sp. TaxID=2029185 RepID=UPI002EDA46C2